MNQTVYLLTQTALMMKHMTRMRDAKVTMLVAPTGYGKTVLVNRFQEENKDALFYLHQVKSHDIVLEWQSFCAVISSISPPTGKALADCLNQGVINNDAVVRTLNKLECPEEREVYLVINDFNQLINLFPDETLAALLRHECKRLHLVMVGKPFQQPPGIRIDPYAIHWIGARDLLFTVENIKEYYQANGLSIDDERVDEMFRATAGWPVAIRTCLEQSLAGQEPNPVAVTRKLLAQASLDRMNREERRLLAALAHLSIINNSVVSFLSGSEDDRLIRDFLSDLPLMYYNDAFQVWHMQDGLREYLLLRFENSPWEEKSLVNIRLGEWSCQQGNLTDAIGYYYRARDYEAILELDLKLLQFAICLDVPMDKIAREIIERCPMEIKGRHPLSLLRLAYLMYGAGEFAAYAMALRQAETLIDREKDPQLYGEWLMISMLQQMPDLSAMHAVVLEASHYLLYPSNAIALEEPAFFGCPSMWYLMYSTPGEGDLIASQLENFLWDYQRVTGGRGNGTDLLYKGELASMRCQYDLSRSYANSAAVMGESSGQPTVVLVCPQSLYQPVS